MSKIVVAAIDDQPDTLKYLDEWVAKDTRFKWLGIFNSVKDVKATHKSNPIELLICDIEMPVTNGFELISSMVPAPEVIFISAYPHYALPSFEFHPLHFIQKPLQPEKILEALERAYLKLRNSEDGQPEYLFLKCSQDKEFKKVYFQDITHMESLQEYQRVYLGNGDKLMVYERLKDLCGRLPEHQFLQIHRSYCINLMKIKEVTPKYVLMDNGVEVPVSRTHYPKLQEWIDHRKL